MGVTKLGGVRCVGAAACLTLITGGAGHAQVASEWPPSRAEVLPAPAIPTDEDERTPITFVDKLVIDGIGADGTLAFFHASDVDVLPDGRIVVADEDGNRIAVLSPTGQLLGHIGRQGQGPGEFPAREPQRVAATASYVVAGDVDGNRLHAFGAADQAFAGTISLPERSFLWDLMAMGEDSVLTLLSLRGPSLSEGRDYQVGRVDLPGGNIREILRVREAPVATFEMSTPRGGRSLRRTVPGAGAGGRIHVAANADYFVVADPLEYTLVAFDTTGRPLWTVRLANQRAEITPSDRTAMVRILHEMDERRGTTSADSVRFVETKHPAIRRLEIDPEGRLFVYRTPRGDSDLVPVDVYDSTGTLLVAATIDRSSHFPLWRAAHTDTVYAIEWDAEGNTTITMRQLVLTPRNSDAMSRPRASAATGRAVLFTRGPAASRRP